MDEKPICIYGSNCYRVNPDHLERFRHPQIKHDIAELNSADFSVKKKKLSTVDDILKDGHGFFLNQIENSSSILNNFPNISLKKILDECNGKVIESIHFNYMFDFEWLIDQYPISCKNNPIYIVYGKKGHFDNIKERAKQHKQIILCPVQIKELYGTHHTKMIILRYDIGIRIVIHTANLIPLDWSFKTQGLWISPILTQLGQFQENCKTNFKNDLLEYLSKYDSPHLDNWRNLIRQHNFSSINVYLIASVPGKHRDGERSSFGHLKLRKILKSSEFGPTIKSIDWPVICQFSSIGSLGKNPDNWLTSQFLSSLSSIKDNDLTKPELKCIYPTVENVRISLEGYPAGSSLPYSHSVASRQPYLEKYLYQWKASISDRNEASPHIKSYFRLSSDCKEISWFCLTSANLSKAAWGELQLNGSQLHIKSFEIGVLFLPKLMINQDSFKLSCKETGFFPLPFDVPLVPYDPDDKPWIWDLCYVEKPDLKGNIWMPNTNG